MIKLILCGVWVCVVTLAASYAAVSWESRHAPAPDNEKAHGGMETLRSRMISVPIIRDGAIQGYVMAQFVFTADAKAVKRLPIKPDVVILDEAFKTIYGEEAIDFRQLKKQDLAGLAKRIVENANKRFGVRVVEDALIQELNYIAKERVRAGVKQGT